MMITHHKINVTRWFIIFCLLHVGLWTMATTFFHHTIPFDTAEGFAWGTQWQWGYDKHPPLAPWLTALFGQLGGGVGFATYLLSQLSVLLAFVCIFNLGKQIMSPLYALISVFLFEGIDFYTLASPKFDPDVLSLATWALTILLFYQTIKDPKIGRWIGLGFAVGLAMLTKYTSILLLISMLVVLLTGRPERQQFKQIGIYIGLIVFLLTLLPHLIWLIQHHFISISYAMERGASHANPVYPILNHIWHPIRFILEESSRFLPVILLMLPCYFDTRSMQLNIPTHHYFALKFLLILLFLPFGMAILVSVLIGTNLHAGWAFPFFSLSTLSFVYFLRPTVTWKTLRQFTFLIILVGSGLLIAQIFFIHIILPYFKHTTHRTLFPMQQVALDITKLWEEKYHRPLKYVAGSRYLTALMTAYSPQHPKPYYECHLQASPWINENELKKTGAVFVWWVDDHRTLPAEILARFPNLQAIQIKEFPMLTQAKVPPLKIGIAFLQPYQK